MYYVFLSFASLCFFKSAYVKVVEEGVSVVSFGVILPLPKLDKNWAETGLKLA